MVKALWTPLNGFNHIPQLGTSLFVRICIYVCGLYDERVKFGEWFDSEGWNFNHKDGDVQWQGAQSLPIADVQTPKLTVHLHS